MIPGATTAWLDWLYAFVAGEEPTVTVPGLAYMLQGGSDASNTDPFATEPAAGEEWVSIAAARHDHHAGGTRPDRFLH